MLDEHGTRAAWQQDGRGSEHHRPRMNAARAVGTIRGALPALVIVRAALRAPIARGGGQREARATDGGEEHQEKAEPEPEHQGPSNTFARGLLRTLASARGQTTATSQRFSYA